MIKFLWVALFAAVFFTLSTHSWAADYKNWVPLIPDSLGGLKANAKARGENLNWGEVKVAQLTIVYGKGNQQIELAILHNSGAAAEPWADGEPMSMETSRGYMKMLKVKGFDTMHTYEKSSKESSMSIHLRGKAILTLNGKSKNGGKDFLAMANELPLDKLMATLN